MPTPRKGVADVDPATGYVRAALIPPVDPSLFPLDNDFNVNAGIGNQAGAYTLDLSTSSIFTIVGTITLTGDLTVTVTGNSDGDTAEMLFVQDATGSHAVSILANGQTIALTGIPSSGAFVVRIASMDQNVFAEVSTAAVILNVPSPIWTGTIGALVNGQLDPTLWPIQQVAAGHLTVLTDPLGTQGTVMAMDITETG